MEERDGIRIFRTAFHTAPRNRSKSGQLRSYLSFVPAVFRSGLRAGPVDVILATSPPIFPAVAGMALARLRKARFIFDIRDLWPDEIMACGAAREGSLPVRLVRSIERRAYRMADCVACTTPAFIEEVVQRGTPRVKTLLLPNGADLDVFRPLPHENPVAARLGLGAKFVVMYSGLLGIKHGLDTVLETACLLKDHPDIVFVLVGSGARQESLSGKLDEAGLQNVVICGEQPMEDLPWLLARADVCLSTLLPNPYFEKIISVKIFEYMACGKAVIASQSGESARIVREAGGGLVTPPGEPRALSDAILLLYRDPAERLRMGQAGHSYVQEHYSRSVIARRLEQTISTMQDPHPAEVAESTVSSQPTGSTGS